MKSRDKKTIKQVKLLGVRTAKETLVFTTVNFSVYSFWVEYEDGSAETIEVSPTNPNDKRKKEKALFDSLMAKANEAHTQLADSSRAQPDINKTLDGLKTLKDLLDANVITQDIYDLQREKLLQELNDLPQSEIPQHNLSIIRRRARPAGESRTIVIIDGVKRTDVDLDTSISLTLPSGSHSISFQRAAVKSKEYEIVVSGTDKYEVVFEPKMFSIEVTISNNK